MFEKRFLGVELVGGLLGIEFEKGLVGLRFKRGTFEKKKKWLERGFLRKRRTRK